MTSAPRVSQSFPRPGEIFDPVGRALDVVGDRWTLVLVRQLLVGPKGFQELRKTTGIAPRVLSGRLRQLVTARPSRLSRAPRDSMAAVAKRQVLPLAKSWRGTM